MPTKASAMPLSVQTLKDHVGRFSPFGIPVGGEAIRENAYGVAFFNPGYGQGIECISQYTRDGEIWGINADVLRQGEHADYFWVLSLPLENLFITSLSLYVEFMGRVAKVQPPFRVIAGIEGVKGARLVHNGMAVNNAGVMHLDRVTHSGVLRASDKVAQDAFLLDFFKKIHANTGIERPRNLYGRE